jgi:CheY-like chemotaxis protein
MQVQHVLYVEDDPPSRQVMELLMRFEVHVPRLTIFEDSENFLARVKALPVKPDVVLLDIHVKPLDGFTMLSVLRENGYAETMIVALTASVMNDEVKRLETAGFNGVIAKPVNVDVFPKLWERIAQHEKVWGVV